MHRSWGIFTGPLRKAIHRMKYKRDISLGDRLSEVLFELVDQLGWRFDLVTAVPLNPARAKERGYNQSALLAIPVALAYNIPYKSNAIRRVKNTRSQVGLTRNERKENVHGAFEANANLVKGRSLLIIDDVCTTGATLEACAQALKTAGARQVYGLTLARAVSQMGSTDAFDGQELPVYSATENTNLL